MSVTVGSEWTELRERSAELDGLSGLFDAVTRERRGRIALVYGEAGIGKTALVRKFCDDVDAPAAVLWGRCDELFIPRPLGPFMEIADRAEPALAALVRNAATPYDVATAFARHLASRPPTVLVLEDVHLADEATLDTLRIVGGRVVDLPVLLVATYRNDAIDRWHPLRIALGELGVGARVDRIRLDPLSQETVSLLAAEHDVRGEELYRKTGGNPFYVSEALAAESDEIPETVRDAILGRAARLSTGARRVLEAVAVARPNAELWLLEGLANDDLDHLEEAVASGIVHPEAASGAIAFRHELARLTIEEATPPDRLRALHRGALELLRDASGGAADPARLAHHAEAVGDAGLVLELAPIAAAAAARVGAHREAAVHYGRALRFADAVPLAARAQLFAGSALEHFLTVQFEEAEAAQREAIRCLEELGNPRRLGAALSFGGQLLWQMGSRSGAIAAAERALELLAGEPSPQLVGAHGQMSCLLVAAEQLDAAAVHAARAAEIADQIDDVESRLVADQAIGWVEMVRGAPGGLQKLVATLNSASELGFEFTAGACYVIIVRTAGRRREWAVAERFIAAALEYCATRDLDVWRYYLLSWRSKVGLARGRWSEAAQDAQICLAEPCPFARIHALVALGLVRARRGDPDVWGPLDEALRLAEPRDELQWIAPVAIARAEAAWLEGRFDEAVEETRMGGVSAKGTWYEAGINYWRRQAGADHEVPADGEEQYRLEMQGEWAAASERWRAIDCPYDAAFALLAGDEGALRTALAEFRALGAAPAADVAAARLRALGARSVPRGPRARTQANPGGLTSRELEVLALLADGLRDREIADRLVVSERTVNHHVSAILGKLGVKSRSAAAAAYLKLDMPSRS